MLVVAETLAIAVLGLLACGLLRSHAAVLRALDGVAPRPGATRVRLTTRRPPTSAATEAVDLAGTTPSGEPVLVRVSEHDTLIAFLSSGCNTCSAFWPAAGSLGVELPGTPVVVVTKGDESPDRIRALSGDAVAVVMSTDAWDAYDVPLTPYFVHVSGGQIVGQGSGASWPQVVSLLHQARGDARWAEADVDRQLLAAGLRPGDPSLYPSLRSGTEPALRSGTQPALRSGRRPE